MTGGLLMLNEWWSTRLQLARSWVSGSMRLRSIIPREKEAIHV